MSILGDRISPTRKALFTLGVGRLALDAGRLQVDLTAIPAPDFDLAKTLESGQVFHWEKIDNGFVGTIGELPIYLEQHGGFLKVRFSETPKPARERRAPSRSVADYFALDHPLAAICRSFPDDPAMNAATKFCRGLRIIRQPKWECLAMFICSSMKQVAHIRQISWKLRESFGEPGEIRLSHPFRNARGGSSVPSVDVIVRRRSRLSSTIARRSGRSTSDHVVYTFPNAQRIAAASEEELRECALGYRAKNLLATARLVSEGEADLEAWSALDDVDLRTRLCSLPGVGAKVANCVMLFAYERLRAFPIDVWIERVLRDKYFPRARKLNASRLRAFTEQYFGQHGGYAQQYLFHHARTGSRKPALHRNDKQSGLT